MKWPWNYYDSCHCFHSGDTYAPTRANLNISTPSILNDLGRLYPGYFKIVDYARGKSVVRLKICMEVVYPRIKMIYADISGLV